MIAAGIVARAAAKKLASRAVGGITKAGAKQVNPVYRNIGSSVKVVPSKTTPKTGLENRGNKVSRNDRAETAKEMLWDKSEKAYEASIDRMAAGMKGPKMGAPKTAGKKNQRKIDNLKKAAKTTIKINSSGRRPTQMFPSATQSIYKRGK